MNKGGEGVLSGRQRIGVRGKMNNLPQSVLRHPKPVTRNTRNTEPDEKL